MASLLVQWAWLVVVVHDDILRSCSSESVLNRDITQFKLRPIEESEVHELLLGLQMNKATGLMASVQEY